MRKENIDVYMVSRLCAMRNENIDNNLCGIYTLLVASYGVPDGIPHCNIRGKRGMNIMVRILQVM